MRARSAIVARAANAAAILLLAGWSYAGADGNLLVNPTFDTGLAGWQPVTTPPSSSVVWNGARDAGGSSHSGSAEGTFAGSVTGLVPLLTQCVPLELSKTYLVSGEIFIPSGHTSTASAFVGFLLWPTPDCSGTPPPSPFRQTPAVTAVDRWTRSATTFTNTFAHSASVTPYIDPTTAGTFTADFDDLTLEPAACAMDANTLCLNGARFAVTATFDAGQGNAGKATVASLTDDTGYLWFFNAANVEAIVKVIDGCGDGGHFWFFAGGLTDVEVTITVTDRQTGAQKVYTNPAHTPFAPIQDTSAFPCS